MKTYAKYQTNGKTFIQVSEPTSDDLGFKTNKLGFIEVEAEKAESIMEKINSNEIALEFGAQNPKSGLYSLQVVRVEVEATQEV